MGTRKRANTWSDLPRELLESIADRLGNSIDVSRFRSVCESWRFSVKPFSSSHPISFPLNLPCFGSLSQTHDSLVVSQSTLYHLSDPSSSSSSYSSSWLVKLRPQKSQRQSQTHVLVNPLSPVPINPLPDSFPKTIDPLRFRVSELARAYSIQLSNSNSTTSQFCNYKVAFSLKRSLIAVVASGVLLELSLKNPNQYSNLRWKAIDDVLSQLSFQDVVEFRERLVAVDDHGRTVEIIDGPKASVIARQVAAGGGGKKSLVVSGEYLLLVDAFVDETERRFRVYKLDEAERRWDEIRRLDQDRVVFLGEDCSFSIPAGDLGEGFEGNCVIFRDPLFMVFTLSDLRVSSLALRPEYAQLFHPPVLARQRTQRDSISCLLFNSLCL